MGAGLEDLGKGLRSQVGTMYGTLKKGPRYLEMAEGYVTGIALDADDQIIGYLHGRRQRASTAAWTTLLRSLTLAKSDEDQIGG